jgi:hypothetical protein
MGLHRSRPAHPSARASPIGATASQVFWVPVFETATAGARWCYRLLGFVAPNRSGGPQDAPCRCRPGVRAGWLTMKAQDVAATAAWCALAALACGCGTSPSSGGSIAPPAGCSPDSSLVCESGGDGWRCDPGDNPETEQSGLSCSIAQPDGLNNDFCCIAWPYAASSCTPDDELGAYCWYPSYGYQCESGDDPGTLDSSLKCSASSTDPDGVHADFCCQ